jgi:hypothetical protein
MFAMFALFCWAVPSGSRQRANFQGVEASKHDRAQASQLTSPGRLFRAFPSYPLLLSRLSSRLNFSLNNFFLQFLLLLFSSFLSPCSALLLMLSGDGAVYDFILLTLSCKSAVVDP